MAKAPKRVGYAETIPCKIPDGIKERIADYAQTLHKGAIKGLHGQELEAQDVLFQAAVERLRGQRAASMSRKRKFLDQVLSHLQSKALISSWKFEGGKNRFDYKVRLGDVSVVIEAKGGLDGNNTNIFQRPNDADEFYIWSLSQNLGSDLTQNVWSGLHTRLGPHIIKTGQRVDGLVVWDWLCGTAHRPCPKLSSTRPGTRVGDSILPPPCLYLLPRTIPDARDNPNPPERKLSELRFLSILAKEFGALEAEVVSVRYHVLNKGRSTFRTTTLIRGGRTVFVSEEREIKQSS